MMKSQNSSPQNSSPQNSNPKSSRPQNSAVIMAVAVLTSLCLFLGTGWGGIPGLILGYFTPLPLLMTGLAFGFNTALWTALFASALGALVAGFEVGIFLFILFSLPVLTLLRPLEAAHRSTSLPSSGTTPNTNPAGCLETAVSHLCIYAGVCFFSVWLGALSGGQGGLLTHIETTLSTALDTLMSLPQSPLGAQVSEAELRNSVLQLAPLLPSAMVLSWFTILAINTALADVFAARIQRETLKIPALSNFRPPKNPFILVTGLAGVLATGDVAFLAKNLTIILAIPYFLAGLAVCHWTLQHRQFPVFIIYLALFIIPFLAVIIVFIGVVDRAVNLRGKTFPPSDVETA